jgi:hypothetical protein
MGKTKPIITDNMHECIIPNCKRTDIHWHHVFFGNPGRSNSDKYGLIVPLCLEHHEGMTGVHRCRAVDLKVKQMGQRASEEKVGSREEFMKIFGRNYL